MLSAAVWGSYAWLRNTWILTPNSSIFKALESTWKSLISTCHPWKLHSTIAFIPWPPSRILPQTITSFNPALMIGLTSVSWYPKLKGGNPTVIMFLIYVKLNRVFCCWLSSLYSNFVCVNNYICHVFRLECDCRVCLPDIRCPFLKTCTLCFWQVVQYLCVVTVLINLAKSRHRFTTCLYVWSG